VLLLGVGIPFANLQTGTMPVRRNSHNVAESKLRGTVVHPSNDPIEVVVPRLGVHLSPGSYLLLRELLVLFVGI